ncbi:MAG: ribonuclease P protein component [Patescibacteria group bacterium]|jgi:ribonuclease P protein component
MLPRAQRITQPGEFRQLYRSGKRAGSSLVTIYFLKGEKKTRAGFVVSTKVAKQSVHRNRMKRVLRETFRDAIKEMPTGDYAIVVKPRAHGQTSSVLREDFIRILQSIQKRFSS